MKKVFIAILTFLFAVCIAYADEVTVGGDSSQNIIVGDVETPVYEVSLGWEGMVYDWAYLPDTETFGWKVHPLCIGQYFENETEFNNYQGIVYTDDECTTQATEYSTEVNYHYLEENFTPYIIIEDLSSGGTVTPSVSFAAVSKYNFTIMGFIYDLNNGNSTVLSEPAIPNDGRLCMKGDENGPICEPEEFNTYVVHPVIGIDSSKTINTPTSGETIGTITVTFAAN